MCVKLQRMCKEETDSKDFTAGNGMLQKPSLVPIPKLVSTRLNW